MNRLRPHMHAALLTQVVFSTICIPQCEGENSREVRPGTPSGSRNSLRQELNRFLWFGPTTVPGRNPTTPLKTVASKFFTFFLHTTYKDCVGFGIENRLGLTGPVGVVDSCASEDGVWWELLGTLGSEFPSDF